MDRNFNQWLLTFVSEKQLDLSEPIMAGDGSYLQAGDVFSLMMVAPPDEQAAIKRTLVQLDFHNRDVMGFVSFLAKQLSAKDSLNERMKP